MKDSRYRPSIVTYPLKVSGKRKMYRKDGDDNGKVDDTIPRTWATEANEVGAVG